MIARLLAWWRRPAQHYRCARCGEVTRCRLLPYLDGETHQISDSVNEPDGYTCGDWVRIDPADGWPPIPRALPPAPSPPQQPPSRV